MSGSIRRYFLMQRVRPPSASHLSFLPSVRLLTAYTFSFPFTAHAHSLSLPSANVSVHDGFSKAQARTASTILSTVQSGLSTYNVSKVLITGHSLGAAIATMDAVMLRMQLPDSVEMNTVVFGAPRGGNEAWADLVDSTVSWFFSSQKLWFGVRVF